MIERLWLWLTEKVLGDEWIVELDGYTTIKDFNGNIDGILTLLSDDALVWETDRRELHRDLFERVGDDVILDVCESRGITRYQEPVEALYELPDEKGRIYVWTTETEREREQVLRWFGESNADPEALHFVLCELEELREIDEQELKPYLGGLN